MSWVSEIIGKRIHGKEKIYCRFTEVKEVLLKNKAKVSSFGISTGNCIDVFVSIHLQGLEYAKKTCGKHIYYRAMRVFKALKISVDVSDIGLLDRPTKKRPDLDSLSPGASSSPALHGSSLGVSPLEKQDLDGKDKDFGYSLGFPGRNLQLH